MTAPGSTCPACGSALPIGVGECPDCGLVLLARNPGVAPALARSSDGLITIAVARTQIAAQILIGRLGAEGIFAITTGEMVLNLPHLRMADPYPVRIQVLPQQAARALQVLVAEGTWTDEELARYLSMLDEPLPDMNG
ncbi:MAG TPA: hypothetical protein VEI97_07120 [bacterium]|nr:hypothetical protein [bacterium]